MLKRTGLVIVLILIPVLLVGQSLGELAKKEKERRKKNQEQGVEVRVIEKEEVSETSPAVGSSDELEQESEASEQVDVEKDASPSSSSNRQEQEREWRARFSEARERLDAAQKNYQLLSEMHLTPGEYYVDEDGNPLITSLEQLRGMVSQAKQELDAATRAMERLKEDARRAGVPPGWVR